MVDRAMDFADQRSGVDRRSFSWRTVLYGFLLSRRRHARREDEGEPLFTDYHHPWLFLMATGIMVMSFADAVFTLALLERGASEMNPFMAAVIGQGTQTFALTKMLMTGGGILALVFLARWMFIWRIRTGFFLTAFFSLYAMLMCYEIVLLLQHN